jgi:hypothetical protein
MIQQICAARAASKYRRSGGIPAWWASKSFKFRGCGIMYPQQSVCVCVCCWVAGASGRESLSLSLWERLPAPEECAPPSLRGLVHLNERVPAEHKRTPDVLFILGQVFILFLFVCDLPHKFRVAQIKATRRSHPTLCACFHVNFHFLRFILPSWLRPRKALLNRLTR